MSATPRPPTVYLVDDDEGVRRALARVLREEGWNVLAFESAAAFLAAPRADDDACLVLDVTMPGLDGLALQRHLADAERTVPIVFVTGRGDIPMSVRAMKAGAADFLTKPVDAGALASAVRAALERQRRTREARREVADLKDRWARLTPREREVLAALAAGKLNKQIAAELGVVEQTIKFHRARIMERMRAKTLAELMLLVARLDGGDGGPRGPASAAPTGPPGEPG